MGKYMRKCKMAGEIAVMEVAPVGVRTRSRTLALVGTGKRKRTGSVELGYRRNSAIPSLESPPSLGKRAPDSRCSSDGSSEILHEDQRFRSSHHGGFGRVDFNCSARREAAVSSNLRSGPDELESTAMISEATSRRKLAAEKMPSELEIEAFFSEAEKAEKKRFAEKYNFDVETETPSEGRYEWVRVK